MSDLFAREQKVLENALTQLAKMREGTSCSFEEFEHLVKEYGRLLRQLRTVTRVSDRTTIELNTSKLDLLSKVHYDALTGIYNRRFAEDNLNLIIKDLARTESSCLSVLIIDVDFFKKYNDTYGHNKGDECLKTVAEVLKNSVNRARDFVARYGGEEFVAVLPGTDVEGAHHVADRIVKNVEACNLTHEKNIGPYCVTVSVGATTGRVKSSQVSTDYINLADKALYISKQSGRNKYTFIKLEEESS